jgi:hypothetical protein
MVQPGRSRTRLREQQQITGSICDMNRQQQQAAAAATPTALSFPTRASKRFSTEYL